MKTLYAAAIRALGFTLEEAAAYHNIKINTVKHWTAGRRPVPAAIWDELRREYRRQQKEARHYEQNWIVKGKPPLIVDATAYADPRELADVALFVLLTPEGLPVTTPNTTL